MSGRRRFFTEIQEGSTEAEISGEEFIHAKTVQRVEEGSEITLLDGSGKEYAAIVTKVSKHSLTAHITGEREGDKEPETFMYLLCGALKGDKTELVVQKATELGAGKIGVFSSEYCSAYMNENKLERLNKVAREAAKQCMRSRAPEVVYFDNFASALESANTCENKIFACEFAKKSDINLSKINGSTAIVVGSEGGFSEKEAAAAQSAGFSQITLGKRILRAETAAIALLSLVAFGLGELK
ncbi:MAG: 16S rRNA (uracil(1498)-N(3))-methyltransferase [Clostridia bacterium]|nr:16S rRNA (uracil(1498)-N(3))-methyltransferase [Clostridia bacterium]